MPRNAAETARLASLAKSFTSSMDARDRLATALRKLLGVSTNDSFYVVDDGVDDALGPVVIYHHEPGAFSGNGLTAYPRDTYQRRPYSCAGGVFQFGEADTVRRRADYVRDSAGDESAGPGADEVEIPSWLAQVLAQAASMAKGAGHKYIRRVPKAGGGYRYFYRVSGGQGLGHESEMVVGAKFKVNNAGKEGHFEIVSKNADGTLTIKHDESGQESTVTPAALHGMLHQEHAKAIGDHRTKLAADIKAADDPKAKAKLLAEAGKYGHTKDLAQPHAQNGGEPAKKPEPADHIIASAVANTKNDGDAYRAVKAAAPDADHERTSRRVQAERAAQHHDRLASAHKRAMADGVDTAANSAAGHAHQEAADALRAGSSRAAAEQANAFSLGKKAKGHGVNYGDDPVEKKPEPAPAEKPKAEDVQVTHNLTPAEAKKLDYRMRAYDIQKKTGEAFDEMKGAAKNDEGRRWLSGLIGQVNNDPFRRVEVPFDVPKGMDKKTAKQLTEKVAALRSSINDDLQSAGHYEAHDSYDTHKIHQKAYQQTAENVDRALGVKGLGQRMLADTSGPGLHAISDAALHGKGKLSEMAAKYAEEGRRAHGKGSDIGYYQEPAYSGGPRRADQMTEAGLLKEADYSTARARMAKDAAEAAEAFEAKGFDAGSKLHRAVEKRETEMASFLGGVAKEKKAKADAEREAQVKADKAKKDAEDAAALAHLHSVAKKAKGEDVIHITTGGGSTPVIGKVHHGAYAVHEPVGSGPGRHLTTHNPRKELTLTHMKTGLRIAGVPNHASGKALADKLHAAVPGFGSKSREDMTDAEMRTAQDTIREHLSARKSMTSSPITPQQAALAKGAADSHRDAATRQPNAEVRAAHLEAADLYDVAAGQPTMADFRKSFADAQALGKVILIWTRTPPDQVQAFPALRKSLAAPRIVQTNFAGLDGTIGDLGAMMLGTTPVPERIDAVEGPAHVSLDIHGGNVARLRKGLAGLPGVPLGQTARMGVRYPAPADLGD